VLKACVPKDASNSCICHLVIEKKKLIQLNTVEIKRLEQGSLEVTGVDHFMVGNRSPTWLCNRLWRVASVKFATFKVSNSTNFSQCIAHTFFCQARVTLRIFKKYTKSWNLMPRECQHFERLLSREEILRKILK